MGWIPGWGFDPGIDSKAPRIVYRGTSGQRNRKVAGWGSRTPCRALERRHFYPALLKELVHRSCVLPEHPPIHVTGEGVV